ncbi:unnamed protein product [Leptosia nina]|uniref:Uncharacterized protein n=1 Tax=Leptosia nina TaxID=320188 RepID=A0AAV1JPC0_9NEOP
MRTMSISVMTFITLFVSQTLALEEPNNISYESLAQCLVLAAKNSLMYKPTIVIKLATEDRDTRKSSLIDTIIEKTHSSGIPVVGNNDIAIASIGDYSHTHIFIIDECEEISNINFKDDHVKFLIVFLNDIDNCKRKLRLNEDLINEDVTILYPIDNEHFIFMSAVFQINETICRVSEEVNFEIINSCVGGSLTSDDNIFPKKIIKDLKRCPLNAGIGELYPYMNFKSETGKYENLNSIMESDIKGSDVKLLKLISEYFNATVKFFYIYKEPENPYTDTEFVKLLLNGSLDICAGGLYRIFGDVVEYSGVYTRQAVVWAYSVGREPRSWQSFMAKVNGLYIFLIFYAVHIFIWKVICRMDRQVFSFKQTLLLSWGALIGASSLDDARTIKQKLVNGMYLILSLHLSAYISVQLYSYLTIQSPPQMYKSIDDLMGAGVKPYLKPASKYFIKDRKYERIANTSGDCDNFRHCQEVILEKKGTTILIDGYMPIYQVATAVNDEARVIQMHGDILFIYHEMILRKGIYFGPSLRQVLLHLFEAGICKRLYDEAIGLLLTDKARFAAKNVMSNSYSCLAGCKITLRQSAGAFYIWIFGYIYARLELYFPCKRNVQDSTEFECAGLPESLRNSSYSFTIALQFTDYKIEVHCAVPIDIVTQVPGHTYRPIIMFIPDKKPILSRRYDKDGEYYTDKLINTFRSKYKKDWVKVRDSYYVDDVDIPFNSAKSKRIVPGVGHGADTHFRQLQPILKKMLLSGFVNNKVMDAVKRWQYNNWWKERSRWPKRGARGGSASLEHRQLSI